MNQVTAQTHQLVVIDSQVNNYQSLVSDVGSDSTVLMLDSSSDGFAQISDYLTTLPSCVFQSKAATKSRRMLPPISFQSCH